MQDAANVYSVSSWVSTWSVITDRQMFVTIAISWIQGDVLDFYCSILLKSAWQPTT